MEASSLIRERQCRPCKPVQFFSGHTHYVTRAFFTPDGKRIMTASQDSTVQLWDARSGRELKRYEHPGPVEEILPSPDGSRLLTQWFYALHSTTLTLANKHCASLWDVESGGEVRRFCDEMGPQTTWQVWGIVGFSPDGVMIPIVDLSGKPSSLWNAVTGERIREYARTR
jgi:WD40 repeat protein